MDRGLRRHAKQRHAQRADAIKEVDMPVDKARGTGAPASLAFRDSKALRQVLKQNHARVAELWVRLYRKGTGKPSITWPELVDQLLCFGWIDGVRKSVDEESYVIRITPRRAGSTWSVVNLRRARELEAAGLMEPAGLRAWEQRDETKSRSLLLRAGERVAGRGARGGVPSRHEGVDVLPGAAAVVPPDGDVVGHEREETGDAAAPAPDADRRFRQTASGSTCSGAEPTARDRATHYARYRNPSRTGAP
jgi:hypothetical protein